MKSVCCNLTVRRCKRPNKMATVRLFRRRINVIAVMLVATTLWISYLILSAPAATGQQKPASDHRFHDAAYPLVKVNQINHIPVNSVTRRVIGPPPIETVDDDVKAQLEKPKIPHPPPEELLPDLNIKPFGDEVPNNVIVGVKKAVYLEPDTAGKNVEIGGNAKVNEEKQKEKKENQDPIKEIKEDIKVIKNHIESLKEGKVVIQNGTKLVEKMNATEQAVLKKVESKVLALGESMKNKTLQKLADLGVYKKKQYEKLIYQHTNWNLSLSVEDIGNIIKDTEYFQKKQNLTEMEYQPLMQPNSSHLLNVTAAKYGLGYCDCQDLSCLCCVRVFNKRMRLNSTSCAAIVYSSKSLELQYEFSVDKKQYFSRVIAAEFPPKICLEAAGKVAGLCTLFSNVTAKVNVANEDHKIHLSGCMEFDLTVYNKTVSSFPVGCFQIPGLSSVEKEKNKAPNMINFMP